MNAGTLASLRAGEGWMVRAGIFRSLYNDHRAFTHLLTGVTPEGSANRRLIVDPIVRRGGRRGIFVVLVASHDDTAVGGDDLRCEQVVTSQAEG